MYIRNLLPKFIMLREHKYFFCVLQQMLPKRGMGIVQDKLYHKISQRLENKRLRFSDHRQTRPQSYCLMAQAPDNWF